MINQNRVKSVFLLLVALAFTASCVSSGAGGTAKKSKKKAYDPTGTWEYVVETPDGGSEGTLEITGNPGEYSASLNTDQFGTLEITDLDIVDTNMTGSIEVMGTTAEMECNFDGEEMSGAIFLGEDSFPIT